MYSTSSKFFFTLVARTLTAVMLATVALTTATIAEEVPTATPEAAVATPLPEPTPTPTLAPWPNQIISLQYELQETGYQINQTPANKMSLILAAENLINDACLDISRNRNFEKASPTNRCSTLVEHVLSLDPKNPAAICAKTGAGSSACAVAYNSMSAIAARSDSIALKGKDIDAFIATQYSDSAQEAMTSLGTLINQYYQKKTDDLKKQIISGYAAALDRECKTIAYEIDFEETIAPTPAAIANNTKPFENVIKELSAPTPASTIQQKTSHRRLVSITCIDLLDRLTQLFPDSYPVICTLQTYYSPQCRNAVSLFKRTLSPNSQNKSATSEGIGKF